MIAIVILSAAILLMTCLGESVIEDNETARKNARPWKDEL